MTTGNQTLLLSGSLLSNAATELAQTLRVDLLQLLDRPVAALSRYGLSDACIAQLQVNGFMLVTDLNFLQIAHLRTLGFPVSELPLLTEVCNEVRRTISVGSLSKILKNASENITEIAANLPVKNTFIDFPSLFPQSSQGVDRQPHSCPAFYFDDEKSAMVELEASFKKHGELPSSGLVMGRPGEPSLGASEHGSGTCKPCAWFHHVEGCRHMEQCEFCHMCPAGEIKKRKKDKQRLIKTSKQLPGGSDNEDISTPDEGLDDLMLSSRENSLLVNATTHRNSFEKEQGSLSSWLGSIFAK